MTSVSVKLIKTVLDKHTLQNIASAINLLEATSQNCNTQNLCVAAVGYRGSSVGSVAYFRVP
jgi:hypothetical protein